MTLIEETKTKSVKVIWTCAKKATKDSSEESILQGFSALWKLKRVEIG